MSKKQSLTRAIALGLMLATPFYGVAMAAQGTDSIDKNEPFVINTSGETTTYTTANGTSATGETGDRGGNAGDLSVTGKLENDVTGNIQLTATAGNGGNATNHTNGGDGGDGGKAGAVTVGIVTESGTLDIEAKDILITAKAGDAGKAGSSYNGGGLGGICADGGAATAYGLKVLDAAGTVTVQDITITATAGNAGGTDIGKTGVGIYADEPGIAGKATADGVQLSGNNQLAITSGTITVQSTGGKSANVRNAGDAGDAVANGWSVDNSNSLYITTGDLEITATGGNILGISNTNGTRGKGGQAMASGFDLSSVNNASIQAAKFDIKATGGAKDSSMDGATGGSAVAAAVNVADSNSLDITISDNISVTSTGNAGTKGYNGITAGNGSYGEAGDAGNGGAATATGFNLDHSSSLTIAAQDLTITAVAGGAGEGGSSYLGGGAAGLAGAAQAYGLDILAGSGTMTANDIVIQATAGLGGDGGRGQGTDGSVSVQATGDGHSGGIGGTSTSYGVRAADTADFALQADSMAVTATGGTGGVGGAAGRFAGNNPSLHSNAGEGGVGGAAISYGLNSIDGAHLTVITDTITATAKGGAGGVGGAGYEHYGQATGDSDGGTGGTGGIATAYGAYAASGSQLNITADSIAATATGGLGGQGGIAGTANSHVDGAVGQDGKGTAYGVYAASGSTVTLQSASNTLNIGVTATGTDAKAYAVYADSANVFFSSSANLNKQANDTTDNSALTYLQDSTLGFVDTAANAKAVGRTVTGGTLELAGSNTFRFATDLRNNTADSMTYNSLATGSTANTQYITVAYDKSFDGSDLSTITGDATVLHFDNLNGNDLTKFEGKASAFDNPLESFIATPTIDVNGSDVIITSVDFAQNGHSESVMAAADGHMALGGIWRAETNNLMKRMGDLRSDPEAAKGGVWARYYRGKQSANGAYERSFEQTYTGFQGGIDRMQAYKDGRLVTGLMVNRIDGTSSYHAGNGEMSSTGMGLYASWLGNKGHYLDVIARMSKLNNNFKLTDKSGNFASGDYSTWAYGISAEYGYRHQLQAGWFIEPQAELTFSHINSSAYTMSNGLQVNNDAVNSTIGRIGFMTGKAFKANGRAGNAYIKASLLHEFGGKEGGQAYYQGKGVDMVNGDLGGTWYELGIGANLGLSKNANFYMDALKTFNGKIKTDWQFNAGVRFSF